MHKATEFQSIIRFRCKVNGKFIQLYAKPNDLNYPRLGLIITRKLVRKAVRRNRLRRLLREVFRVHQHELDNMDYVFRLQRALIQVDSVSIRQEAEILISRLRIRKCRD